MKELINNIIRDNQLKVMIDNFYDVDIIFSYFEDKEDFSFFYFVLILNYHKKLIKTIIMRMILNML